jgi:hypothetical protein
MVFEYDPNLVPDVKLESEWKLEDGSINQVYRAGDWSFETSEEANIAYTQKAIYAWIAWHDFLKAESNLSKTESADAEPF